jgi:hypothetical protein
MRSRQGGAIVFVLVAVIAVAFLAFCLWTLSQAMTATRTAATLPGAPVAAPAAGDAPFTRVWSLSLRLVTQVTAAPGPRGYFIALSRGELHLLDPTGTRAASFAAPAKTSRIAGDPSGRMPFLIAVSRRSKWTGAIDHTVTTDYFLHALDTRGREVWQKRFDPKELSAPEPVIASLGGRTVVLLGGGQRVFCYDQSGGEVWNLPLWHHPGTLAAAGDVLLAAQAPRKGIVRISPAGRVIGAWGTSDVPSRFVVTTKRGELFGLSIGRVSRPGSGDRHAVTFYDGGGRTVRQVELPPDTGLVSYTPLAAANIDGETVWVVPLGDGTILLYSPQGDQRARYTTGSRIKMAGVIEQSTGPDLLVTATESALSGWRMQLPR